MINRIIPELDKLSKKRTAEKKIEIEKSIKDLLAVLSEAICPERRESIETTIEILQEALDHLNRKREDRSGGLAVLGLL
ncbi:hypothetical protein ACRTC3_07630 [Photobacterium damselae]|uniref:hypothetical protein n=1 Tax=Photobacterium damselae TaxID=38293 RepID=UPI003D7ECDB0